MSREEWRKIPDFPNYSVSDYGNVRRDVDGLGSCKAGRILKQEASTSLGHRRVRLCAGKVIKAVLVHRLVASVFDLPKRPDQNQVAHNDGNASNNHISNLRWATAKENYSDREAHGTVLRGEKNWRARHSGLSEDKIQSIRGLLDRKVKQAEIAKQFGIAQCTVSEIKHRRIWGHVA